MQSADEQDKSSATLELQRLYLAPVIHLGKWGDCAPFTEPATTISLKPQTSKLKRYI